MSPADVIQAFTGDFVEPQIVIEASIPLELSGEAVRGRICTFSDDAGKEWALRPDLTLPVAVAEVALRRAGKASGETLRGYRAPVFRLPALAGEPVEFSQLGFERFGAASGAEADAELFAALCGACQAGGVSNGTVTFGDLSVFPAFVDALALADDVAAGLKRAFRQEGGVRAYLQAEQQTPASGLAKRFEGMDRAELSGFVQDIFALTGIRPVGERSSEEIVERLFEKSRAQVSTHLSDEVRRVIEAVLAVDVAAEEAVPALRGIGETHALNGIDPVLKRLQTRLALIRANAGEAWLEQARFATRFGRRFTYYDGFVFEIAQSLDVDDQARPFAAGGRYDALLADLSSGDVDATALGGVVIPHRLKRAMEAQS